MEFRRRAVAAALVPALFLLQTGVLPYGVEDSAVDLSRKVVDPEEFIDTLDGQLDWAYRPSLSVFKKACEKTKIYTFDLEMDTEQRLNLFCEILVNSEACRKVSPEKRVGCRDFPEEFGFTNSILGCIHGVLAGAWNVIKFVWDLVMMIIGGVTGILTGGSGPPDVDETEDMGFLASLVAPYHKAVSEGKGRVAGIQATMGGLMDGLLEGVTGFFEEKYANFGCYSPQYKSKMICEGISTLIIPPAAAFKILQKTGVLARSSKMSRGLWFFKGFGRRKVTRLLGRPDLITRAQMQSIRNSKVFFKADDQARFLVQKGFNAKDVKVLRKAGYLKLAKHRPGRFALNMLGKGRTDEFANAFRMGAFGTDKFRYVMWKRGGKDIPLKFERFVGGGKRMKVQGRSPKGEIFDVPIRQLKDVVHDPAVIKMFP